MNCGNCGKPTKNPKFCSKRCSAIVTNKLFPRRKRKIWSCFVCGKECKQWRKYCSKDCTPRLIDWSNITFGEVVGKRKYQRASRVRQLARQSFTVSGLKKECVVCGYSKHIEVCHIKPITDFLDSSFITEINDPDNLLPLCPNHHWEFDNGLLSNTELPLVRLERT